jgi:hypothetical protein
MAVVVVVIIILCVQVLTEVAAAEHLVQDQDKDKHMDEVFILDQHM